MQWSSPQGILGQHICAAFDQSLGNIDVTCPNGKVQRRPAAQMDRLLRRQPAQQWSSTATAANIIVACKAREVQGLLSANALRTNVTRAAPLGQTVHALCSVAPGTADRGIVARGEEEELATAMVQEGHVTVKVAQFIEQSRELEHTALVLYHDALVHSLEFDFRILALRQAVVGHEPLALRLRFELDAEVDHAPVDNVGVSELALPTLGLGLLDFVLPHCSLPIPEGSVSRLDMQWHLALVHFRDLSNIPWFEGAFRCMTL
mmetsp:Transcript_27009/g.68084  ORF Transcript_27009/g.68084 Transcript_27009/m.68084 type:complete len:262 (+) Transcript_27009:755-1540(+)